MSVGAKDKGTGKEQQITIQASGGLSDEDIEQMVKDAEENAAKDAEERESAEAKNEADNLCYTLEKAVTDAGDKAEAADQEQAEDVVKRTREAIESGDKERIVAARDEIRSVTMELG